MTDVAPEIASMSKRDYAELSEYSGVSCCSRGFMDADVTACCGGAGYGAFRLKRTRVSTVA